ncbi:MAG: hypothetical protein A2236_12010 [Bacteroidetes bacterium RIFOXYA2_FULL_33_7]|nr:MAG: hypothetical protein A2236_12010 [Bacteroidetes bacterium RIFOXYA2_FULL_33_7]
MKLPKAIFLNGKTQLLDDITFKVEQKYQVLNIADFCNECGNCTTFCPTSGAPYKDKPKFYLTLQSFRDADKGYTISKLSDKTTIIYKENKDNIHTLTLKGNEYIYETNDINVVFDFASFEVKSVEFISDKKEAGLKMAAELKILLESVQNLYIENSNY